MTYTYKLYKKSGFEAANYTYGELAVMPTFQLQEICRAEKIMTPYQGNQSIGLSRDELIQLILRYRGIKKNVFQTTFDRGRIELLQQSLKKYPISRLSGNSCYGKLTLYKGLPLTVSDQYLLAGMEKFHLVVVLLTNTKQHICGLLSGEWQGGVAYLTMQSDMLSPDLQEGNYKGYELHVFTDRNAESLINAYNQNEAYPKKLIYESIDILQLQVKSVLEESAPLFLDFGSAYTAASTAAQGGRVRNVEFYNEADEKKYCDLCPSMAVVKACKNEDCVEFLFGFEALEEIKKGNYLLERSIFFDLKRLMKEGEELIDLSDGMRNCCSILGSRILREFFLYVVNQAQIRHKCYYKQIVFAAPLRQSADRLALLQKILPEFNVTFEDGIDECMAILYGDVHNKIQRNAMYDDGARALILHCGSSSSELLECEYGFNDTGITYDLQMKARLLNEDTFFGGNSITFRIYQYLKVKLAEYYGDEPLSSVSDLLGDAFWDPYSYVDEGGGTQQIYSRLEEKYSFAEMTIPTFYAGEGSMLSDDYFKLRNNYILLWFTAEEIKKILFEENCLHQLSLNEDILYREESGRIRKNLFLYLKDQPICISEFPHLLITKEEISALISPDIYDLVKRFIEPLCDEDEVLCGYEIKLAGQTCKIPIFRDALKEYTVGRRVRTSHAKQSKYGMKLRCVEGLVSYFEDKRTGAIRPEIISLPPLMPYRLIALNHMEEQIELISCGESSEEAYGMISRPLHTREAEFLLKNYRGDQCFTQRVSLDFSRYEKTDYSSLDSRYGEILKNQGDIDNIRDGEIKLFFSVDYKRWEILVLPIARKAGSLYADEIQHFPFEGSILPRDFFDGYN